MTLRSTLLIFFILIVAGILLFVQNIQDESFGRAISLSDVKPIKTEPATYAEIDKNGEVLRVIVISEEMIQTGKWGDPSNWVRTYKDGTRNEYAGKGYTYDETKDAFIRPKPHNSWTLNQENKWEAPGSKPIDSKNYIWNEKTRNWTEAPLEKQIQIR